MLRARFADRQVHCFDILALLPAHLDIPSSLKTSHRIRRAEEGEGDTSPDVARRFS
jgi:hypothetical protein